MKILLTSCSALGMLVLSVCLLTSSAYAQPRAAHMLPDSSRIAILVDSLAKKLVLTAEQKQKVSAIYFEGFAEFKKTLDENRGNFRVLRTARRKMVQERQQEIKKILTEEQKKKYEVIIAEQRKRVRAGMGERMRRRRAQ